MSFFSLLPLGEGREMRAWVRESFFHLCCVIGEWHSKIRNMYWAGVVLSPHPNPLPLGEGAMNTVSSYPP